MKTPVRFPAESRILLESPGVTVESAFVNDGAKRFLVIVHQVALNSDSSPETPAVVKFSERQYALPHSQSIQLATPEFYRCCPGEDLGIRDEKEASYIRKMDLKRFLETYNPQSDLAKAYVQGSTELTFAQDDCWMFCTSVRPTTKGLARQLGGRISEDYECGAVIDNPSEFARELGVTFGTHLADADLRLGGLDTVARYSLTLTPELGEMVVRVYHGPVVYTDNPAAIVESYPEERRAAVVPFLKRSQYSYQREYRFVVETHGEAVKQALSLPVSDDLRRLTEGWDL